MYEDDARSFAVALYLDHGFTYEDIAFLLGDSRKYMGSRPSGGGGTSNGPAASTVREWVERFLADGDVAPSAANASGAAVFDAAELEELRQYVDADPTMMLDELVYHMYQRTGKYVEVHSMCRILHRLGLSHKNVAERMLRGPEFHAGAGRQEEAFLQFQYNFLRINTGATPIQASASDAR
jgi:transposase